MAVRGIVGYGSNREAQLRIEVSGLEETIKALRQYDPEARKQLIQGINQAAKLVRDDARKSVSKLPVSSGWRNQQGMPQGKGSWQNRQLTRGKRGWPPWDIKNVKKGITSYTRRQKNPTRNVVQVRGIVANKSGEGVIYEFARFANQSKNYPWVNSVPFINALGKFKGGRIIWAAYERRADEANKIVLDALQTANARLQEALLRSGGE